MCVHAQFCLTLRAHQLQPARPLCLWDFPGKNTGDLPDPGIETVSPVLQADSLQLSHQGSTWRVGVLSKHFLSKQKWAPSLLFPVTPKAGALPLHFRRQLRAAASQMSWV